MEDSKFIEEIIEKETGETTEQVEKKPDEEQKIPYSRFSEVVTEKNMTKAELSAANKKIVELEAAQGNAAVESLKFPIESDYEDNASYQKAISDYTIKAVQVKENEAMKFQVSAEAQKRVQDSVKPFWDRVSALSPDEGEKAHKAIEALVGNDSRTSIVGDNAQEYLKESEVGPQLLIHLNEHPEALDKIAGATSFVKITRILDKIAENMKSAGTAKTVSSAPKPVTMVSEGSNGAGKSLEDMTPNEMESYFKSTGALTN